MPRAARLGGMNVVLSDVSIIGAGIQHHIQVPSNANLRLTFSWEKHRLELRTRLVRSRLELFTHGDTSLRIYHSGLLFVDRDDAQSELRTVIADRVTRALNRQRADAFAEDDTVPDRPLSDSGGGLNLNLLFPHATTAGRGYIRCAFEHGRWNKEWVTSPEQPDIGFTVSAQESPEDVELLCKTYSAADFEERRLIRVFAHLSIAEPSDVPRNKFAP